MDIVDAQIHVWAANSPERPWVAAVASRVQDPVPWTAERTLAAMDEAGVRRVVIVPPSWDGDRNDLALAAAAAYPDRFSVMCRIDMDKPADPGLIASWKSQKGMRGLRFTLSGDEAKRFLDGSADWVWDAAEKAGVPVYMLPPGVLPHVAKMAERHPGLRIIIDHLALMPGKKDDAAFEHLPELFKLAKFPNVAVKASALPCHTTDPYPFKNLHKYIRQVYDNFGPDRMFWGSDLSRLPCSYKQCITLFTEEQPWLTQPDKELIMGKALCRWLDWPL